MMGEAVRPPEGAVSLLRNFFHYRVDVAFIFLQSDGYRLVVYHHGARVCDDLFATESEARAGFLGRFGYEDEEANRSLKQHWSEFSRPEQLASETHHQIVKHYLTSFGQS